MVDTLFKYLLVFLFLPVVQNANATTKAINNDTVFNHYFNKARQYRNINNDTTIYYALKAIALPDKPTQIEKKVALFIYSIQSYKQLGKYALAIQQAQKVQQLIKQYNLAYKKAKLLMWIGNIYQSMGFSSKALEYLFQAAQASPPKSINKEILYYTALVYYSLNEIEKCQDYARRSLTIQAKKNNLENNVNIYNLLSNTYNTFDSINFYLNKAYQIVKNNPQMTYKKVVVLNNQALLYDMVGKTKLRDEKYIQAIKIAKKNQFIMFLTELYNNYSYSLMEKSKFDSARILIDTALIIAKSNKNVDMQASLYDTYSDLYKYQEDYKTSLHYLRTSIRKRADFKKQQQIQTSLFLSTVFETQKKEKALLIQEARLNRYRVYFLIGLLLILILVVVIIYFRQKVSLDKVRMENLEKEKSLEIADAMIKGQDEERKRLSMDLHDGLGARLGALRLKVDTVLYENPHYYDIYSSIDSIARNVRELSHRMLPARLSEIGLIQSLQNLIKSVNSSSEMTIDFQTNIKNKLEDKFQVNLYYLIYELINNAIKHSQGKNLTIQLFIEKEILTLSAEDDGIGFDISKKGKGHGLNNIKQRVDYLNGKLLIESQQDYGSVFMIEIPMK